MSRRRYITSEISTDKRIRRLSNDAALLYTWMIPHAEEDATITADPDELAALVFPNRPKCGEAQVARWLAEIEELDLVRVKDGLVYYPPEPFYRIQSNVHVDKRRTCHPDRNACIEAQTAENSGKQRRTAENSASPSPSPSPSPSTHMSDKSDVFESFWSRYPKKEGKGEARQAWVKAAKATDPAAILAGLERQLPALRVREKRFIAMPATWLNQGRWEDEPDGARKEQPMHAIERGPELTDEERRESAEIIRKARLGVAS